MNNKKILIFPERGVIHALDICWIKTGKLVHNPELSEHGKTFYVIEGKTIEELQGVFKKAYFAKYLRYTEFNINNINKEDCVLLEPRKTGGGSGGVRKGQGRRKERHVFIYERETFHILVHCYDIEEARNIIKKEVIKKGLQFKNELVKQISESKCKVLLFKHIY